MTQADVLNKAVAALRKKHPKQAIDVVDNEKCPILRIMGKEFACIVNQDMTVGDLLNPLPDILVGNAMPVIYVTINATAKLMEYACNADINIIDCAGNYNIQFLQKNGVLFFTWANKGEAPIEFTRDNTYPIFKEAGIKVIFYFLLDKQNITKPYREIQQATGVAIGTVKNIIDGMVHQNFAKIEGRKRFLINTDRLLMLWTVNYGQTLKPKLLLATMDFRDGYDLRWQNITLPEGMLWGGEPAAAIKDKFLNPGEFEIYTAIPAPMLIKTGTVLPDNAGNIKIYQQFWHRKEESLTVPTILIYADLMETGNGRCIEAAQKLKENELKYLF